jgi:thiol:disulfide interchange protein DsbD
MALVMACLMASMATNALAQISADDLLPVEEAFAVEVERVDDAVALHWTIAEGYYLYRHAFEVSADAVSLGTAQLPQGEITTDEFFGETETYRGEITMRVPIENASAHGFDLNLVSQGCADLGVCYPPHRQVLSVPATGEATGEANGQADDQDPLVGQQAVLGNNQGSGLQGLVGASALPAEQAFQIDALAMGPNQVLVRLRAQAGYYIYQSSLGFASPSPNVAVDGFQAPQGEPIEDEYFGQTEVYFGEVEVPVDLTRSEQTASVIDFEVAFQGCLTDGICYPPMSRMFSLDLPELSEASEQADAPASEVATTSESGAATGPTLAEQDRLARALAETPLLALALFLVAGVLLAFTPCVFPMVPILSGLIAGQSDEINTARAFRLSMVYVLSMALVYTAFGVVAGMFGQNLQAVFQHPAVLISFAVLFVLLSLAMFGFYELQLPARLQTKLNELSNRAEGGTLMGAAIMGALSALVVGPCVAPALMGALIYIGQTGDAVLGGGALFAMALGMGIPLVIWGTSAGRWLPKAGVWMNAVKAVFGVGLLALAIWMLERVIPAPAIMALWGSLAIACGVYLGALTRLAPEASGWHKLWQALGVIVLLIGIVQWLGALSGGRDWTRPLGHWQGASASEAAPSVEFMAVDTLPQLEAAVAAADGPVFLDFYADWCVDCVRMERRTFVDPQVANRMAALTLIKVDVTDYTQAHQQILSHFDLIGPPAMLFFSKGQELANLRRFGFMAPDAFLSHLDAVQSTTQ